MHNKSVIVAQETERRSKALHVIKTNLVAYNENLEDHLWQYYTDNCLALPHFLNKKLYTKVLLLMGLNRVSE